MVIGVMLTLVKSFMVKLVKPNLSWLIRDLYPQICNFDPNLEKFNAWRSGTLKSMSSNKICNKLSLTQRLTSREIHKRFWTSSSFHPKSESSKHSSKCTSATSCIHLQYISTWSEHALKFQFVLKNRFMILRYACWTTFIVRSWCFITMAKFRWVSR